MSTKAVLIESVVALSRVTPSPYCWEYSLRTTMGSAGSLKLLPWKVE